MSILKFANNHHRFPSEIIEYTIWLFYHSKLNYLDIEELLAERGILVSYESIRRWCNKIGPNDIQQLNRSHEDIGNISNIDCVHVNIHGKPQYLWVSFDHNGNVVDIYIQSHRNNFSAEGFLGSTVTN